MSFSVVIPSRSSTNALACVQDIAERDPGLDIILVDDGAQEAAGEVLGASVRWVPAPQPFVFAASINAGIAVAPAKNDILAMNDDALLQTDHGFSHLAEVARANPDYGVISCVTNRVGNPNQRVAPKPPGLATLHEERGRFLAFVCVLITRSCYATIGPLDERFNKGYGAEDTDYCRRVCMAGLKLGIYDGCFVDHQTLRTTFGALGRNTMSDHKEGIKIYMDKWGTEEY